VAATLPSGAINESAPWTGFSATTITRNGAPFHGATGDGNTVRSAASAQIADAARPGDSAADTGDTTNPAATGSNIVAVTANPRARNI
jgi:hypothetical protein